MATLNELKMLFSNRSASDVAIEISGFTGFRTTLIDELTQEEINKLYRIHTAKFKKILDKLYFVYCHQRRSALSCNDREKRQNDTG